MLIRSAIAALALMFSPALAGAQETDGEMTAEEMQAAYEAYAQDIFDGLTPRHGTLSLARAPVTLEVTEQYDFYDDGDTRKILEDIWGNPPDDSVSGMIFPAGMSPVEEGSWGAVLTYEKTGYVTDDDAATTDYDQLLRDMQQQARDNIDYLESEGYATVELTGWAVEPRYDAETHKLFWAKDLLFSKSDGVHTLNYDMRALGRHGVLSINFIAGMDDLARIERAAPEVLAIPGFNQGSRYEDYVEGDRMAGYGVAALVAGGAGLVALKKGGLMVALLLFLKKGWILLLVAGGAIARFFRRLFGGAREE